MEEGEERIRPAYGAAEYDRLKAQAHLRPTNVFRHDQDVAPD